MRRREVVFGAIASILIVVYLALGVRVSQALGGASPTPSLARETDVPTPLMPGTIAFVARGEILVMRGGMYRTQTSEGRNQQPALSPDGQRLYFARSETIEGLGIVEGQTVPARLGYSSVIAKPSGGGAEQVVLNGLVQRSASRFHQVSWFLAPAVSPDNTRLAYIEDDGSGSDLVVSNLSGGSRFPFSGGQNLADPAWSPDGTRIAVTSYNTDVPGILLWNATNRAPIGRLETPDEGEAYRPSFSADGRWIIYTYRQDNRNDVRAHEIATGRDVALTDDGKSWNPVASPDGRYIAFLREVGGVIDLFAMELGQGMTPGAVTKLTRGEGVDGASRPAWSR